MNRHHDPRRRLTAAAISTNGPPSPTVIDREQPRRLYQYHLHSSPPLPSSINSATTTTDPPTVHHKTRISDLRRLPPYVRPRHFGAPPPTIRRSPRYSCPSTRRRISTSDRKIEFQPQTWGAAATSPSPSSPAAERVRRVDRETAKEVAMSCPTTAPSRSRPRPDKLNGLAANQSRIRSQSTIFQLSARTSPNPPPISFSSARAEEKPRFHSDLYAVGSATGIPLAGHPIDTRGGEGSLALPGGGKFRLRSTALPSLDARLLHFLPLTSAARWIAFTGS
ncbi:Xin actin-binding repeat-containing protein 2 [Striga asiatica]|uniref:Xin actin-binding repeat-containing protein 2 n=1 Tax=Striga asiatica TaxID=4170 RepID=A0A5A7QYY4_STRAF|nr:Xin actin-binding repeat-containing protein 2 [Striga asiatica]